MFISPMLAAPMPKVPPTIRPGTHAVECKYDGFRLILERTDGPVGSKKVWAWTRHGAEVTALDPRLMRSLPPHIKLAAKSLPVGIYDGELFTPGKRSYGVTEEINRPDLVFAIFDVLELLGVSTVQQTYAQRRAYLDEINRKVDLPFGVAMAASYPVKSFQDAMTICGDIWKNDGEGIIIKRLDARYSPGKRPKDAWIKVKALRSAVLTVIGFEPSRGTIQNRGPYAMVRLRDEEGFETTVKTRNDEECRKLEQQWRDYTKEDHRRHPDAPVRHPSEGRKLRIEYQERTPDGSYRHPRWDRWEDE